MDAREVRREGEGLANASLVVPVDLLDAAVLELDVLADLVVCHAGVIDRFDDGGVPSFCGDLFLPFRNDVGFVRLLEDGGCGDYLVVWSTSGTSWLPC